MLHWNIPIKIFRRVLILTLLTIIVTILGLEVLLRLIDPFGAWVYTIDVYRHGNITEPHTSGYRLPAGVHEWASYTVTMLEDGARLVPASDTGSDCTIATIGDSVTFGHSVNDAETFTNIFAEQYRAHWLNTGRMGYAVENMRLLQQNYPADGYIYLVIENDSLFPIGNTHPTHVPRALEAYINFLITTAPPVDVNYFMDTLAQFHLDNVLLAGFENDPLAQAAIEAYGGALIPRYTSVVSRADGHPNPDGHREIAAGIAPHLDKFMAEVCHA